MKKTIFSVLIAVGAVMGINCANFQDSVTDNSLMLANIEALSTTEDGYKHVVEIDYDWGPGCNCWGVGYLYCC
ncbi:hypothetical protein [uncultured Duncaniella sp.]|uniref:NVEALA domain-containing protein n=1 Tax=uncultured Duncaniella sp. TaxID=2768039 RepID=UPI00262599ED|nr:hypothetical protein [uncultured Duncaniella sp.]